MVRVHLRSYSFPSQEIAMRGEALHRYFLVLYAYFFGGKGVAIGGNWDYIVSLCLNFLFRGFEDL